MKHHFGIAILLLSVSGGAIAQTGSQPPRRNIDLRASTRLTYDSNVFRTRDSRPAGGTLTGKGDDFRITPSLDGDILLPVGGRSSVFVNGSVGYDFYTRNSRLNAERLDLEAGTNVRFTQGCATIVSGTYARNRSDFADLLLDPVLFPNVEEIASLGATLRCDSVIGISPGGSYRHTIARNKAAFLKRNDYNSDSFSGDIGYSRPTFGRLSIYGSLSDTTYPRRLFLAPTLQQDSVKVYGAGVRFERDIGSRIKGTVSVGYSWVRPKFGGEDFNGASYSAQIDLQPTEMLNLSLLASRSADVSNLLDISYSITDLYSVNATYRLNPRISLTGGASYQKRDFKESAFTVLPFVRPGDKILQGFVGAQYQWSDRLMLSADFTHEKRSSDIPLFDYKSTRVSVGVSLGI